MFSAALCCVFLFRLILNWKLLEISCFSAFLQQTFYLFTFPFLAFSFVLIIQRKTKTETKKPYFCRFCPKTSVFVANITLIFSDLWVYRANYTPPPVFGTRRVGQLSSENFLFFYFLFFVKYSDFLNSAFLPNFEHFPEYHIYFWFYISFRDIHFRLFSCVVERFM